MIMRNMRWKRSWIHDFIDVNCSILYFGRIIHLRMQHGSQKRMLSMLQKQLLTSITTILELLIKYMLQHYSILMLIYVALEVLLILGGMVIYKVVRTSTLEEGHILLNAVCTYSSTVGVLSLWK